MLGRCVGGGAGLRQVFDGMGRFVVRQHASCVPPFFTVDLLPLAQLCSCVPDWVEMYNHTHTHTCWASASVWHCWPRLLVRGADRSLALCENTHKKVHMCAFEAQDAVELEWAVPPELSVLHPSPL